MVACMLMLMLVMITMLITQILKVCVLFWVGINLLLKLIDPLPSYYSLD
jgi:hypothetical protein